MFTNGNRYSFYIKILFITIKFFKNGIGNKFINKLIL
jgi:hypothetical protein